MDVRRRNTRVMVGLLGVVTIGTLGGCAGDQWHPTTNAMARSEANVALHRQATGRTAVRPGTLVLADDPYSRMVEPATFTGGSGTIMTAGAPGTE